MSVKQQVSQDGFAFLPQFAERESGAAIAGSLGIPVVFPTGLTVHRLIPREIQTSAPNTYSGNYGKGAFPLHTDQANWQRPARYLMLRCIVGFETVPTLLVDGKPVVEAIGADILSRALVRPRRQIQGSLPLLRLYSRQEGDRGLLRWDQLFLKPASDAGTLGVSLFQELISKQTPMNVALTRPGDTLIIDNWRMLHGRSQVLPETLGRVIERAYLETLH